MTQDPNNLQAPYRYVFGPVLSRRLGRSLGVDVVPFKTCTYDCIYCQLGRTTRLTAEPTVCPPVDELLDEVRRKLASGDADFITIAGSGEPTLYADLSALIAGIKAMTSIPVAVITNGSLLSNASVRDALLAADVVMPSLDAGSADVFQRVNRPCPTLSFDKMIAGLAAFREQYKGQLWLEIFVLHGITDTDAEIAQLAAHLERIRPDRIQLNTAARPTPDGQVLPTPRAVMEQLAKRLGYDAEIIAHYESAEEAPARSATSDDVLAAIKRHPSTVEDIAAGLGISHAAASDHVARLLEQDAIYARDTEGNAFYLARNTGKET